MMFYPKNVLIVHGQREGDGEEGMERVVWIDFDVAITYPSREDMPEEEVEYSRYEERVFEGFGKLLVSWASVCVVC